MWSVMHQELGRPEPRLGIIRGQAARASKGTMQAAYGRGRHDPAATLRPASDPRQVDEKDARPPPMDRQDPFMSLAEP